MSESKQGRQPLQKSMIRLLSVADLVTLLNATLGSLALLFVFSNEFHLAASLIFLGLLADGLDGMIARRLGVGKIGEYLESLADMITLSIAPLVLFYKMYYNSVASEPSQHLLLGGILIFSLLCSIIRLSSFSLLKQKEYFIGLPTSASALFLVLISYLLPEVWYVLPVIVVLALAMISSVHFPKPSITVNLVTAMLIVAVVLLDGMYSGLAPLLLLVMLVTYIIGGPLYLYRKKNKSGQLNGR
jgi:CDP-diacylglycerol--serine O-phosphatidyltransferase